MAVQQNQLVEYSDLSNYYTSFNTFIQNYANGIVSTVVLPPIDSNVQPSDLTNLNTRIDSFQSDEFLGTESSLWIKATPPPTVGELLLATTWENIKTTVTNMGLVQCRNRANNTYGSIACNPQSCGGQGTCSKTCSDGSHGNTCSNGSHGNNCSNGLHSNNNGYSNYGVMGTCSWSCSREYYMNTSYGSCNSWTATHIILYSGGSYFIGGSCSDKTCSLTCNPVAKGGGCSHYKYYLPCSVSAGTGDLRVLVGFDNDRSCTKAFLRSCSVTCGYGTRSVSCSNGTRSVSCSNGTRTVACSYSSNSNSSCNYGTKTCTAQGTTIDIRNSKATMSKS